MTQVLHDAHPLATAEHFAHVVDRVELGAEFLEANTGLGAADVMRSRYVGQLKGAIASLERVLASLR